MLSTIRILTLTLLIALSGCVSTQSFHYNGGREQIFWNGLIITPGENTLITVTSPKYEFIILLPYSTSWEFETSSNKPLFASDHDNDNIVSVIIVDIEAKTERECLEKYIQELINADLVQIDNLIFLKENNKTIMKYKAKPKFLPTEYTNTKLDFWSHNYWSTFKNGSRWYLAHWSTRNKNTPDKLWKIYWFLSEFSHFSSK